MKILIIHPGKFGHYPTYLKILSKFSNVIESNSKCYLKIFNILRRNKFNSIIFLNGDRDFIKALIIKVFYNSTKLSIISYYTFLGNKKSIISFLKRAFFHLSTFIGIRVFLVDHSKEKSYLTRNSYFELIKDPITTLPKLKSKNNGKKESEIDYLVFGHVDSRKNVDYLLILLNALCNSDNKFRKVIILGKQSQKVNNYLKRFKAHKCLRIEQLNYKYSDHELREKLSKTTIVWAYYKNHLGSSSVVINSIYYDKKVIFNPIGVLDKMACELGIKDLFKLNSFDETLKTLMNIESIKIDYQNKKKFLSNRKEEDFYNSLIK